MGFIKTCVIISILAFASLTAQPELDIKPGRIEFEDLFNRYDYVFLINKGDENLIIDSIAYKDSLYLLSFEDNLTLPFTIIPDDSVTMNVILSAFYQVTINDTSDTMFVYNNGIDSPGQLEVRIKFFEDEFGEFNGTVKDSLNPVDSAVVYFFYNGIYFLDTARTNSSGFYSKNLPEGEYTIGCEKTGYYVVFHDSTYDPFFAKPEEIDSGEVKTIDFGLKHIDDPGLSVSGQIIDSVKGTNLNRGIVIVRNGTHVPIGLEKGSKVLPDTMYTFAGFVRSDGAFSVPIQFSDYYFVQGYSNYFLPGYYNDEGMASVFWQDADSLLIDNHITDKNILLLRDSSYGAGSIAGNITFSIPSDQQDFEGITLLAKNIYNEALYSYNFGKETGNFKVSNIPYGTYKIVGQKIGFENAFSQTVTIDPFNNQLSGINLSFKLSDVSEEMLHPDKIELYQNYPNPFNPYTNISFYLPESAVIKIKIYNILGEIVETLVDGETRSGIHTVKFNGKNLASGVYLLTLESSRILLSRKMIILR